MVNNNVCVCKITHTWRDVPQLELMNYSWRLKHDKRHKVHIVNDWGIFGFRTSGIILFKKREEYIYRLDKNSKQGNRIISTCEQCTVYEYIGFENLEPEIK